MTRPVNFLNLESLVCSTRYAIELAETACDAVIEGNSIEANVAAYALMLAREESKKLHEAFYSEVRASRGGVHRTTIRPRTKWRRLGKPPSIKTRTRGFT